MNQTIIGIDFSIKNPAAVICQDFKSFKWASVPSDYSFTKNKMKLLEDLDYISNANILMIKEEKPDISEYYLEQRYKLSRYSTNIDTFVKLIKSQIPPNSKPIIALEGVAYGASGNSLIDICVATGMLRYALLNDILEGDDSRLFVFSPSEMKNSIGCKGNADKFAIFEKFMSDPILECIKVDPFYKFIETNIDLIKKPKMIESPFSDLIDSYLAVLTIYKNLKNN